MDTGAGKNINCRNKAGKRRIWREESKKTSIYNMMWKKDENIRRNKS